MATAEAREIAREVTLRDFELFEAIQPREYVAKLWSKPDGSGFENVEAFIRRQNDLRCWVITEVCTRTTPAGRAKMIAKFVKIARVCLEINNLNSVFALVSGLTAPAISRLKKTWAALPKKDSARFDELVGLMDPARNMARYRNLLEQALEQKPLVPWFPLLLKDLYFFHDGNKNRVGGLVNFDKLRRLWRTIVEVRSYASKAYNAMLMFKRHDPPKMKIERAWQRALGARRIQHYFETVKLVRDEAGQMARSLVCEASQRTHSTLSVRNSASGGGLSKPEMDGAGMEGACPQLVRLVLGQAPSESRDDDIFDEEAPSSSGDSSMQLNRKLSVVTEMVDTKESSPESLVQDDQSSPTLRSTKPMEPGTPFGFPETPAPNVMTVDSLHTNFGFDMTPVSQEPVVSVTPYHGFDTPHTLDDAALDESLSSVQRLLAEAAALTDSTTETLPELPASALLDADDDDAFAALVVPPPPNFDEDGDEAEV